MSIDRRRNHRRAVTQIATPTEDQRASWTRFALGVLTLQRAEALLEPAFEAIVDRPAKGVRVRGSIPHHLPSWRAAR